MKHQLPQVATRQAVLSARRVAAWKAYCAANGIDPSGPWVSKAHRYGLEAQELHAMWTRQAGRCYLCREPLPRLAAAHLDHDHDCCVAPPCCGLCARGLACRRCNTLIATADDDPARLRYIARHGWCDHGLRCQRCWLSVNLGRRDPAKLRRIAANLKAANTRTREARAGICQEPARVKH